MTTEPNDGSVEAVAQMLFEGDAPEITEDNSSEAVDQVEETQVDVEEYIAESENAEVEVESDDEFTVDDLDELEKDELTAEPAAPLELNDDLLLDVKSNGEMKRVTLKELKQDFAGQDYIQKGMADNAELRKQLEAEIAILNLIEKYQNGDVPSRPQKPSQELAISDPIDYAIKLGEYNENLKAYEDHVVKIEQQKSAEAIEQENRLKQYKAEQAELIRQEVPELNDPVKGQKLLADIHKVATETYGVPEEVFSNIVHGWEFKILKDAVAMQKLREKRDQVKKKTANARPMLEPGAKRTDEPSKRKAERARANMRKKGDEKSVADWLLSG